MHLVSNCYEFFSRVGFDDYGSGGFQGGFGGDYPMANDQGGFEGAGEAKSEEKKYKDKNIVSVTIKQVEDSELNDNQIVIDGKSSEFVRVVAVVTAIESASTKIDYRISDGTKSIRAFKWTAENEDVQAEQNIKENSMVCIVGNIKTYQDVKSLFIVSMRPVNDHNEMTHHLLDRMMTHAIATKGPVPGSAAAEAIKNQKVAGNYNAAFSSPSGGMGGGPQIKAELGGDGGDDEAIRVAIRTASAGDEGANYESVMSTLAMQGKHNLSKNIVEKFVTAAMNDGTLYNTIDEDHFKLTDDM